jgi:alkylation response protein AidB-like acyl-CoA dehydrogenase
MAIDEATRRQLLVSVDQFVSERITPRAPEIDVSDEFPLDLYRAAADLGLLKLWVPTEYGGLDADFRTTLLIAERIGRVCPAFAISFATCGEAATLLKAASEALRHEFLPKIADGTIIPCFALTEPGGGSDVAAMTTTAKRTGDEYVLNGRKMWITNGPIADLYIIFAKTDPSAGRKGISAFVLDKGLSGFRAGPKELLIGLHGSPVAELILEDVRVPLSRRLGEEGEGFAIAMMTLDEARLNAAAISVGIATSAIEHAVSYAKHRVQFGRPIIEHQGLHFLLADLVTELAASRALWEKAIEMLERGKSPEASQYAAMAKLACTDLGMKASTDAVQVLGANGLSRSYPVERLMRDAKIFQIFDGTNQIQRHIIGRYLQKADQLPIQRD